MWHILRPCHFSRRLWILLEGSSFCFGTGRTSPSAFVQKEKLLVSRWPESPNRHVRRVGSLKNPRELSLSTCRFASRMDFMTSPEFRIPVIHTVSPQAFGVRSYASAVLQITWLIGVASRVLLTSRSQNPLLIELRVRRYRFALHQLFFY